MIWLLLQDVVQLFEQGLIQLIETLWVDLVFTSVPASDVPACTVRFKSRDHAGQHKRDLVVIKCRPDNTCTPQKATVIHKDGGGTLLLGQRDSRCNDDLFFR